ncbi:hypothetical protein HPB49_022321 [Dermacentor silvarum]|uniref:Uncharacterized protein n=1 Tax=Dermacentor silvarum TaxID=543639 RepID=A0ACB8DRL8_DERSI|nr:hypothetical protein HPB49_022321 [Dermacentor silvarum]
MESYVKEQSKGNFFDITPLLDQHEKKLRREIVLPTIRLEADRSGRKKQYDTRWAQKHWEQLKRTILDAQLGGAFSYSLSNLEQIRQIVLFTESADQGVVDQRSSFSDARIVFPEDLVRPPDDETDEGFKTPASGYGSPQSLKSLTEAGTSSVAAVRQSAIPSSSHYGLVKRWRSPDHSPKTRVGVIGFKEKVKAVKRKRLVQSPTFTYESESKSQSPARQREPEATNGEAAHRHRHHHYDNFEQEQEEQPEIQEYEESAERARAAGTLEEIHASLDRLTKIISEMALLISVSTVQSEIRGEELRRRPSSPAAMRSSTRARSISRHHAHPSRERSASASPSPLDTLAVQRASRPSGSVSSRDFAFFPPSKDEEGYQSRRKKGKDPKPQRHQQYRFTPETYAAPVCRKAIVQDVVTRSNSATNFDAPSDFASASSTHDESSCCSRSGSDSELSIPQNVESDVEGQCVVAFASAENRSPEALCRPLSVIPDDERPLLSAEARSPGLFFQHPPFLPDDELPGDHGAFEAASLQVDDAGRLSPGEIQLDSGGAESLSEPTFPVFQTQDRGQERDFRGIARGACLSDPGRFGTELFNTENIDDNGGGLRPVRCRGDDRLPHGGIPLEQGAREEYPSQHIWRWAKSDSDRVMDESAMRRLELYKTTYGGNIDGQPPHMKAAHLRLASSPQRGGQRMCQLQIVCIITPIAQETNSAPTSTVRMQAAHSSSLPERKSPSVGNIRTPSTRILRLPQGAFILLYAHAPSPSPFLPPHGLRPTLWILLVAHIGHCQGLPPGLSMTEGHK